MVVIATALVAVLVVIVPRLVAVPLLAVPVIVVVADRLVGDGERGDAVADLEDARGRRGVLHELLHPGVETEPDHHAELGVRGSLDVLRRRVERVLVVPGLQEERDVRVGTGDAAHEVVDGKDRDA